MQQILSSFVCGCSDGNLTLHGIKTEREGIEKSEREEVFSEEAKTNFCSVQDFGE